VAAGCRHDSRQDGGATFFYPPNIQMPFKFESLIRKGDNSVKIGDAAPDFVLNAENGGEWRLSDHAGKVVVLLFYPQDETMVCTRQMCSLRDHWEDYLETKAEIVGISPGHEQQHSAFAANHKLPLRLLSDPGRKLTSIYGKHKIFPVSLTRAIVVIDAEGIVRSQRIMLRAFRPTDRSVIGDIYKARADAMVGEYDEITRKRKSSI
jgi:peroxiredoxin Q/BCP